MRRQILALVALGLVATACGSPVVKGSYADESRIASPPAAVANLKTCPAATAVSVTPATATNLKVKPKVVLKTAGCKGITTLFVKDLVVGKGAVVKASDTIVAQYLGIGWNTRKEFDTSWGKPQPLTYPLANLIPGWKEGIPGMRVGGRRLLVIPGELAYGANPQSTDIEINETLIFVMDMLRVNPPSPKPTPQST